MWRWSKTVQIMNIQKTKAKCKILPCIISTKEHPECCRYFPLFFPSPGKRGSFLAIYHSNACTDFCHVVETAHYVWDFHTPLMLHLSCSQPTKHPASWFQLHIHLLLSMEKSRSEWGNLPLAWADHLVLAISPWWSWQSYHTFTVKWNWWHGDWWGTKTPCLASVAVLDLALKAKGSLLSPQVSLYSG